MLYTVWTEDISSHSCRIICRCTNRNAADAVARTFNSQTSITTVEVPDHTYRSN
jgi:hypothetical protein